MLTDALLLYAHLSAMLGLAVFLTAKTSLTRAGAAVLLSGLALVFLGIKGAPWLLHNPLLWAKVLLLALMAAMSWPSSRRLADWAQHCAQHDRWAPSTDEVTQERRWLMAQSHVMVVIPLLATLMSHGFG